jgi:hypothetical protein
LPISQLVSVSKDNWYSAEWHSLLGVVMRSGRWSQTPIADSWKENLEWN